MKVELIAASSIDGYIAQSTEQSSLDWTSKEDLRFFIEKTKEAGVVVMGRKTFDTIGKPLKGRELIVMTRGTNTSDQEGVRFTQQSPREIIESLVAQQFERVVIAGGAQIYRAFLLEGLVTDLFITIEPVLFGGGVPLFPDGIRSDWELVERRALGEHATLLHFVNK